MKRILVMKRVLVLAFVSVAVVVMMGLGHLIPAREGLGAGMPVSALHKKVSFSGIEEESAVYRQPGHNSPSVSDLHNTFANLTPPHWWSQSSKMPSLSQRDIDGVEKFVFFVGYPRSGHSIIGSMMDAHPNMIISNEFMLFDKLTMDPFAAWLLQNKTVLFNALYQQSYRDAKNGWRSSSKTDKGYTLGIGSEWHAKFNGSLKVIGEKSGGRTAGAYGRDLFAKALLSIQDTVQIPIRVIHVVRNPYDMIATDSMYFAKDSSGTKTLYTLYKKGEVNVTSVKEEYYKEQIFDYMHRLSRVYFRLARNIVEMINRFKLNVLEIHFADFVKDPRDTISRICTFLDLPCPEDYLQACSAKASKSASKSRHLVAWPEDMQADLVAAVRSIPFFRRYSFEGD